MHRISKITLTNFKFFYGETVIDFERKNVLIYGENGSGKSSIYWALYTFLQSVFKSTEQVLKYFDERHNENLRNRFASNQGNSSISLEFDDGNIRTISNVGITTKTENADNLVLEATLGSDLIEYKTLSRIYHFARQEKIDLFYFFRDNLLSFINLNSTFKKIDGTDGSNNADIFWKYIESGIQIYQNVQDDNSIETFQSIVDQFNTSFEIYLNSIVESTNIYLVEKLKQSITIKLIFGAARVQEDYFDENRKRIFTLPPAIVLEVYLISDKLEENKKRVTDPQSFLNEARLSALALSMRLAILDEKFVQAYSKILILDDMLMSMDMSNREFILKILFESYLQDYQIIFLTHQRGLFEEVKKYTASFHAEKARIAGLANPESDWENHWKIFEMYETENSIGIPIPKVQEYKTSLQKALFYFKEYIDYSACGNNLRSALEEYFRMFIPKNNFRDAAGEPVDEKKLMLFELLQHARKYFTACNFNIGPLTILDRYRERSLNPASHYNPKAEFYKAELLEIFKIFDSFSNNRKKAVIATDQEIVFEIRTVNGQVYNYTACLLDDLNVYNKTDGNPNYYMPTDVISIVYTSCLINGVPGRTGQTSKDTLQGIYNKLLPFMNRNNDRPIVAPDVYQIFTDINGRTLDNLRLL